MGRSLARTPNDWNLILAFNEILLSQTDAASLVKVFSQRVNELFECETKVWLAEPSYPLPGEFEVSTIPSSPAPELVLQAYEERRLIQSGGSFPAAPQPEHVLPGGEEIALPCITQDALLAILHVKRARRFSEAEIQFLRLLSSQAAMAMQVNRQIAIKNWRFDQISLVRSVSSQIANITDLDTLCQRVATLIQCSFGLYFVAIFTLEPGSDTLKFRASAKSCSFEIPPPSFEVRLGEGIIGHVAQSGEEYVTRDAQKDALYRSIANLPETRSEAVIPLMVENRVLGVLDLQSDKNIRFHENDMLVLRSLADNIALAVESARLYTSLERRADQLSAILEINYALSSILDLDQLLEEVVKTLQRRFGYPFIHIFTVHPGRRKVIYQSGTARQSNSLKKNSFAFDLDSRKGMVSYVARTGKPLLANDVSS
jgi:GAF domain-containing protein